jgi:hypothetical protein
VICAIAICKTRDVFDIDQCADSGPVVGVVCSVLSACEDMGVFPMTKATYLPVSVVSLWIMVAMAQNSDLSRGLFEIGIAVFVAAIFFGLTRLFLHYI